MTSEEALSLPMAGTGKRKKAQIWGVEGGTYRGVLVARKGGKIRYCMRDREMGRRRMLMPECVCRKLALGHGRVQLGGKKLHTVTNGHPGLHTERKIERWEVARALGRLKSWV